VKCIGLPCANDFLLITTLAYTLIKTGRYKKRAYGAIKRLLEQMSFEHSSQATASLF
jgi:hypothetical protein